MGQSTNVYSASVDVKYDQANDRFVMFESNGDINHPTLDIQTSYDGIHFSQPRTLASLPYGAGNVGVSGGRTGDIEGYSVLYAYGALFNFDTGQRDDNRWDLDGLMLEP